MVFIGLGSNMGERLNNLTSGVRMMQLQGIRLLESSSVYETSAWGFTDQSPFLNAVISLEWTQSPEALLQVLMDIERGCGRVREIKWGPRVLDLDILMFHQDVMETDSLRLPHPEIARRAFVLIPWAEIVPDCIIPALNTSPSGLLAGISDTDRKGVQYYSPPLF